MRLEVIISSLKKIQSLTQLQQYFISLSEYSYCWSLLMTNNAKDVVLGNAGKPQQNRVKALALDKQNCHPFRWFPPDQFIKQEGILVIPANTRGSNKVNLVLGLSCTDQLVVEKLSWYWQIILVYLYDAYRRCQQQENITFSLTKREIECLNWVSEGKTSWEISHILGISERTVNFHLGNCIHKTNSVNRQQAVSKYLTSI